MNEWESGPRRGSGDVGHKGRCSAAKKGILWVQGFRVLGFRVLGFRV